MKAESAGTPIETLALPQDQLTLLKSLWISTVEELAAMGAAVGQGGQGGRPMPANLSSAFTAAKCALPATVQAAVSAPQPGGGLGCLVEPEVMRQFEQLGRVRPMSAQPAGAFEAKLPPAVRLLDRMQPVRDQGQRGTCVAFGTVALREFLLGSATDLSEQFLYWACKQLDGHPGPGTYVHTAMTALAEYGVCEEQVWPYNPQPTADEGQGPPPPGAERNARQYRLDATRTVEPNLVVHYKHVLAGENGRNGMPVTFGTLVFESWYRSAETHRTGKITLPLPGEPPVGGHAWCVVGYVDRSSVPGGGYFIVRNSWGSRWAHESPEQAGHALMPYEYVKRYAIEAFTGPTAGRSISLDQEGEVFRGCTRILDRDDREELDGRPRTGRLLKAGTRVLEDCLNRSVFREASRENEEEFRRRDCTWTNDTRRRAWFLDVSRLSAEVAAKLEAVRGAREHFSSAIHQNVTASEGTAFPQVRVPWWFHLVPFEWEPKIEQAVQVADLTAEVADVLRRHSGSPAELDWPREWSDLLTSLNDVRVYSVRRGARCVHVLSAFVTPLEVRKQADPVVVALGQVMIDAVRQVYSTWLQNHNGPIPLFTFTTIGSMKCPSADNSVSDAGDRWLFVSCPDGQGRWKTTVPRRFGDRVCIRDFADRLRPETAPERVSRIKESVDNLIPEGGNITVERVKSHTGYRRSVIRRAFLTLQDQAGDAYRVYRTTEGHCAIRRAKSGEPIAIRAASFRRGVVRRHGLRLVGAAVGVAGWLVRGLFDISGVAGFVILVLLVYVTSCIQGGINRRADAGSE